MVVCQSDILFALMVVYQSDILFVLMVVCQSDTLPSIQNVCLTDTLPLIQKVCLTGIRWKHYHKSEKVPYKIENLLILNRLVLRYDNELF